MKCGICGEEIMRNTQIFHTVIRHDMYSQEENEEVIVCDKCFGILVGAARMMQDKTASK